MADENQWEDAEFDAEFEDDDDDDEFNKSGGGWENSDPDDDPFPADDPNEQWGDIDVEENDATEIENKYYEAYYEKDDMDMKLASFIKVIELVNAGGDDTDDFKFKSLTEIVILYIGRNEKENVIKYFKEFLNGSNKVKPNDLSSNLRKILNTAKTTNVEIYNELHDLTMTKFNPSDVNINVGSIKHLWFDLGIERCHEFMAYKMYQECEKLINELHQSLKSSGTDDKSQTAKLLQVYAVKIQLTMLLIEDLASNDLMDKEEDRYNTLQFELRELINITQGIMTNVDIIDNKAMSIIYECWAKVYASNNDWINCYKYFKESFLLYQQIAHKNTTKCLKSLLISYMILSSLPVSNKANEDKIPNPFAMDEISVYKEHPQIIIMNNLVNSFENDDINTFNKLLKQQHETDAFITKYLALVQLRLQGKALCNLVASYDRVKLKWLCHKLGMNMDGIEKLVVKLIIDGELNGRLDQVNMFLILKERDNKTNAILNSLSLWLKSVNNLRNSINTRAANKMSQSSFGGMRGGGYGGFGIDYFDDIDAINDELYVMDQSFLSWN